MDLTRGGHRLKDASKAVVWLTPVGIAVDPPVQKPSEIPQLVQRDKTFHPSLIVIPAGGKVEFPNRDPFFHNVFSMFDGKRFDLGLYEGGTTRFVKFDKPGISFIFCNIHSQMSAVVIALATPYYAVSDVRGEFSIPGVPPGRYQVRRFFTQQWRLMRCTRLLGRLPSRAGRRVHRKLHARGIGRDRGAQEQIRARLRPAGAR